ncbi:hypothetical protein [Salinibacter ruber]|uniref:hypothetical protein n=1 Tax=Salinibacter ruber TaxID=146919 RepID=UPI000E58C0A0|nr:hypothetical protein [Salinibacter ruber]
MLEDHNGHRAFACYILGSSFISDFSGQVIITAEYVTHCYGMKKLFYQGQIRAVDLLRLFRRDVAPGFDWDDDYGETKAREVTQTGLHEDVVRAAEEDFHTPITRLEEPVHFMDGNRITPTWQTRQREDTQEEVEQARDAPNALAGRWRDYLHDVPVRAFNDIRARFEEAREVVREFNEPKKTQVARTLSAVEAQPKPFYGFSERTVRLASEGQTLQSIDSDVRSALLQDYQKFDLKSAQLAVASKRWDCDNLHSFLDNGNDVWGHLCDALDVAYTAPNKAVLKKGLYSTVYGGAEFNVKFIHMKNEVESLRQKGHEVGLDIKELNSFSEIDLMAEVYEQRSREMKRVQENGGAKDIFGNWMSVKVRNGMDGCDNPVPSILAAKNQAVEMWLLEPVLSLAESELEKTRPYFRIILNLHDGFAVRHYRRKEENQDRLVDAVNERTEGADIPTVLEIEE